jgi:hypothetical protein
MKDAAAIASNIADISEEEKMQITEHNKEDVRLFVKILLSMGIGLEDGAGMIVAMLKDLEEMDKIVTFIEENADSTAEEIMDEIQKMQEE